MRTHCAERALAGEILAARDFQEARAAVPESLQSIPLAVAADPAHCRLRGSGLAITSATLTPEGIWVRYHGDARDGGRREARAWSEEITAEIRELSITDDTGGTYLLPAGTVPIMSGRRSASGGTLWVPEGKFLATHSSLKAGSRGSEPAVRWLEFSAGFGQPVRVEVLSPAAVLTGTTEPHGRSRQSVTWRSSRRRRATGQSAPSRRARWNLTLRQSWPPSPTRCSPSARCRPAARCSRACRAACAVTGGWA